MPKIAHLVVFICLVVAGLFPGSAYAQKRVDRIVAVVGADVVSSADVDDRLKLILASSGLPNTQDVLSRVRPQVVAMLVEETIKTQEVQANKIDITDTDVDQAIATIAAQNKLSLTQFKTMLKSRGVPLRTLTAQIRAQMGWNRLVARRLKSQADVRDVDIDAELDRLGQLVGQDEYLLAEIVLPVDGQSGIKNAKTLADRLVSDLRQTPARFPTFAQQFSRAAGAAQGGTMGWVSLDQLGGDIARVVDGQKPGTLLGPIATPTSYMIFFVRDVRTRTTETIPTRDAVRARLALERLDRLQKRYYMDVRAATFVENRDVPTS